MHNATVEDMTIEPLTTQNLFFMAPTKAGAKVGQNPARAWTSYSRWPLEFACAWTSSLASPAPASEAMLGKTKPSQAGDWALTS